MRISWPKRRWFQFSLRTLLALVTLCAIPCSWLAVKIQQAKREEAAAAAILKVGDNVYVYWDESVRGPAWLRGFLGEHLLGHVETLRLREPDATDSMIEPLQAFHHLQFLELYSDEITDAGLEHLQGLRELKQIKIEGVKVTDAGLENLAGLSQLEKLDLCETNVTDSGLDWLTGLNKLTHLYLEGTNVTDYGLIHLQRMKQLRYVILAAHVTPAGVRKLRQALPNCQIDGP